MEESLWDYHVMGGMEYMTPITLTFVCNIALIIFSLTQILQKKEVNHKLIATGKHLGGLALALGVFGTIVGFFQVFDALEAMKEILPFQVIMGGLKVTTITTIYGLIVFCISLFAYIMLKLIAPAK